MNGVCIEFDPYRAIKHHLEVQKHIKIKDNAFEIKEYELEKMTLIVAYNSSDMTYGWEGRISGFTLHYSHFTNGIS